MQTISLPYFRIPTSPRCQLSFLFPSPFPYPYSFLWFSTFSSSSSSLERKSWKFSVPFHPEKKNETRRDIFLSFFEISLVPLFSSLFFPFLIIINPLANQSPILLDNFTVPIEWISRSYSPLHWETSIYICIFVKPRHETFLYTFRFISSLLGMHLGHRPSLNDTNGR